jgi:TRAP-type C4-dicarboxylate transport system permease small subunit
MKWFKYCFEHVEVWVSSVMFCVMSLSVALQLISRLIGHPLTFTEEIARFSYIWIVFLCISLGEKRHEHYSVSVFTLFLKGRAETALEIAVDILGCIVFLYLFYWTILYWPFTMVVNSPALEIPMVLVSMCLSFGFGLACINRAIHIIRCTKLMFKGGVKK